MTTLPGTEQDAPQGPPTPPPSPWSAPRPDGPLAAALLLAQTQRAAGVAGSEAAPPASPAQPEALEHDIEALAREAKARDDAREALAIALEWPEETGAQSGAPRPRRMGWLALGGALLLAAVAAAIAVSLAPADELAQPLIPSPGKDSLKLEKRLSPPLAARREASR